MKPPAERLMDSWLSPVCQVHLRLIYVSAALSPCPQNVNICSHLSWKPRRTDRTEEHGALYRLCSSSGPDRLWNFYVIFIFVSETAANLPGRTQTWCLFCCPIQKKTVSMSTLGPEWLFFALEEIIYSKQRRWLKRSRNYANILKLKTGFAPNV